MEGDLDWFHHTDSGWTRVPGYLKHNYEITGQILKFNARGDGFYSLDSNGVEGFVVVRKENVGR